MALRQKKQRTSAKPKDGYTPCYFAPNGKQVIATAERLWATCKFTGTGVKPNGRLEFDYDGETDINWDSQETVNRNGELVFLDCDWNEWLESQLVVRYVHQDDVR